jgi:prepilin-type N-terminal cleavage/methylation domain-containing protein
MSAIGTVASSQKNNQRARRGFSLIELMMVCAVLMVVLGAVFQYIDVASQRSKIESTKVDLAQEGRQFVDEFERDLHQSGYPSCRQFSNYGACGSSTSVNSVSVAAGLVSISSYQVTFEGDVDGDGNVDTVIYRLVDSAGNAPPTGTCPCTIQRSQATKASAASFSQELQGVVNSGNPAAGTQYGGGLNISGNGIFRTSVTNTAYYAAVSSFKDYPVFQAYGQDGAIISVNPQLDNSTAAGYNAMNGSTGIKAIRLTINLLGSDQTGYDPKTGVRPVVTLVGTGRMDN